MCSKATSVRSCPCRPRSHSSGTRTDLRAKPRLWKGSSRSRAPHRHSRRRVSRSLGTASRRPHFTGRVDSSGQPAVNTYAQAQPSALRSYGRDAAITKSEPWHLAHINCETTGAGNEGGWRPSDDGELMTITRRRLIPSRRGSAARAGGEGYGRFSRDWRKARSVWRAPVSAESFDSTIAATS